MLTTYVELSFNYYKHQTTNNFEKLLTEKKNKNTAIVTAPILITICMHIRPIGFLENDVPEIGYGINEKI